MERLKDKSAIITGGGSGIGRSIALTFAKEGADVVVCGRTLSPLEKVSGEIGALGRRSLPLSVDVSIKSQVQNLMDRTIEEFGKIDILVNNAGIGRRSPIVDMSEEDWDAVINVNLKGVFLCIQAAARHMIKRSHGKIINISSIVAISPPREGSAVYGASKAGVELLTKAASLELIPYGINVNSIAPGAVETPMYRKNRTQEQIDQWLAAANAAPIGRIGDPQEISNTALFLASDESAFICGETIVADGGRNARLS
jgi:NAD(P)-dependent dehydrogenase (short-subunit alcohol dehydrogenase family)